MKILRYIGLTLLVFAVLDLPVGVMAELANSSATQTQVIRVVLFMVAIMVVITIGHRLPWKKLSVFLVLEFILISGLVYFANGSTSANDQASVKLAKYNKLQSQLESETEMAGTCYRKQKINDTTIEATFIHLEFEGKRVPDARQAGITKEILEEISAECSSYIVNYEAKYEEWKLLYVDLFDKEFFLDQSVDFSPISLKFKDLGSEYDLTNQYVESKL